MQSHLASTSSRSLINHLLALQQSVHLAGQPQASGRTQSARKPLISSRCVGCGTCQGPTVLHSPTVIQPGQSMCFALPARTWSCTCCPSEPALAINPMVDSSAVSLSTDTLVLLEPGVQCWGLTWALVLQQSNTWYSGHSEGRDEDSQAELSCASLASSHSPLSSTEVSVNAQFENCCCCQTIHRSDNKGPLAALQEAAGEKRSISEVSSALGVVTHGRVVPRGKA
ncbi:unnamed protein product [Gadus morhua 'NCC']